MVGNLVVILVNLAVLLGFFVYFRRRIDRALQTENILRDIRSEVDEMIVDLNQTTDRNVGLVEDQLARLAARIAEADRRIVVLKKESEKTRATDAVYTHLKPPVQQVAEIPPNPPETKGEKSLEKPKSARERVLEMYRSGLEAREIATKLGKTLGEVELIISLGTNRA